MTDNETKRIINKIRSCIEHDACENINCAYFTSQKEFESIIELINTRNEEIHCKDCRYQRKGQNESDSWNQCVLWKTDIFDEFYCASAEQRDNTKWEGVK